MIYPISNKACVVHVVVEVKKRGEESLLWSAVAIVVVEYPFLPLSCACV